MKNSIVLLLTLFAFQTVYSQTLVTQARPMDEKEWGYVNIEDEWVIEPQYRNCQGFSDGFATIYFKKEKTFGFVDLSGNRLSIGEPERFKVIETFGFGAEGFSDGLVAIISDAKWGFLNTKGEIAIELKYEHVTNFDGGYAVAEIEDKYFVLDASGNETAITDSQVERVKEFSEGLAPFESPNGKHGFINPQGEVEIENRFTAVGYFNNGMAWAKNDEGKLGYINKSGEWVIEPQFLAGKDFDKEAGLARIKDEKGWAYVNTEGEVVRIDITIKWGDFSEGLAAGRKEDLFGFYNADGEWAIEPAFENVRDFKNGYAAARKGDKWGFIDKTGNWVIEPKYDDVRDMEIAE